MNGRDYLAHVARVAGITIPRGTRNEHALQLLHGLFQKFRPRGEGIDKLFEPLEDGPALAERMRRIFLHDLSDGTDDFFFIPRPATDHLEDTVDVHVQQFMHNLLTLLPPGAAAHKVISAIDDSEYVLPGALRNADSGEYAALYNGISAWEMKRSDDDHPITVLNEAFRSVNGDPWLAIWMKWPVIGKGIVVDVGYAPWDRAAMQPRHRRPRAAHPSARTERPLGCSRSAERLDNSRAHHRLAPGCPRFPTAVDTRRRCCTP
jgi:hypothetical protein